MEDTVIEEDSSKKVPGEATPHVVVPACVGVGSTTGHKMSNSPPISSEVMIVEEGEGVGSTPPPNCSIVMEMKPHSSDSSWERSSHEHVLRDCTASTEFKGGEREEDGVRHSSPESFESC